MNTESPQKAQLLQKHYAVLCKLNIVHGLHDIFTMTICENLAPHLQQ